MRIKPWKPFGKQCAWGRPLARSHQPPLVPYAAASVVDADLARYFDSIDHGQLLRQVARRVSDGMILKLIKSWLRACVVERDEQGGRRTTRNTQGTPQGGVISPLLANIYLHPLDEAVNEGCREKPRMIRYADDLVILCRPGEGKSFKERLARWLEAKGLALNETKTRVLNSRETGFEFLGFTFRWQRSRKGSVYVHTEPSPSSRKRLHERIRELTPRHSTWRDPDVVVPEINAVVRGWGNYFALGHYGEVFGKTRRFISRRVRQWLWCKHRRRGNKYERWPDQVLAEQYGLYQLPTAIVVERG